MNTRAAFIRMVLAMPATGTKPHGNRTAFTANKKIFATLHSTEDSANLKLSLADQYVYSAADPAVYPVPNGWARLGYTTVEYRKIPAALLKEILGRAYAHATEKRKK